MTKEEEPPTLSSSFPPPPSNPKKGENCVPTDFYLRCPKKMLFLGGGEGALSVGKTEKFFLRKRVAVSGVKTHTHKFEQSLVAFNFFFNKQFDLQIGKWHPNLALVIHLKSSLVLAQVRIPGEESLLLPSVLMCCVLVGQLICEKEKHISFLSLGAPFFLSFFRLVDSLLQTHFRSESYRKSKQKETTSTANP